MTRLEQLRAAGVSIWLDTLSRELLDSGAFAALIADSAVTGATSNPTIFAKAITTSDRYDEQLRAAAASGIHSLQELSSWSRSRTSLARPICCAPPSQPATAATGSCPSSAPLTSRTTPARRSSRRSSSGTGSTAPTS